jgi:hypothetical protein
MRTLKDRKFKRSVSFMNLYYLKNVEQNVSKPNSDCVKWDLFQEYNVLTIEKYQRNLPH